MPMVFISYAREDVAFVEQLASWIQSAGLECWWDRGLRSTGKALARDIEDRLKISDILLVVWSAASVKKEWVVAEVHKAQCYGKKIVMIAIDGADRSSVPLPWNLRNLHVLHGWEMGLHDPRTKKLYEDLMRREEAYDEVPETESVEPPEAALAWHAISSSVRREDYLEFLDRHPESEHAKWARDHLAQLDVWAVIQDAEPHVIDKVLKSNPYPGLAAAMADRAWHNKKFIDEKDEILAEYHKAIKRIGIVRRVPDDESMNWWLLAITFVGLTIFLYSKDHENLLSIAAGAALVSFFASALVSVLVLQPALWLMSFYIPITRKKRTQITGRIKEIEALCPWVKPPLEPAILKEVEEENFNYRRLIERMVSKGKQQQEAA